MKVLKPRRNSNTTLVKVKSWKQIKTLLIQIYSNTTLVKVKFRPNFFAGKQNYNSNTTLAKVKWIACMYYSRYFIIIQIQLLLKLNSDLLLLLIKNI